MFQAAPSAQRTTQTGFRKILLKYQYHEAGTPTDNLKVLGPMVYSEVVKSANYGVALTQDAS